MDAAADGVPQRVAEVGGGWVAGCTVAHDPRRDPVSGGQQEVPRSAGRVDHGKAEKRLSRVLRPLGAVEHSVKRRVEQRVDETVARVVGAGGLALVASGLGGVGGKDKRAPVERPPMLMYVDVGLIQGGLKLALRGQPFCEVLK